MDDTALPRVEAISIPAGRRIIFAPIRCGSYGPVEYFWWWRPNEDAHVGRPDGQGQCTSITEARASATADAEGWS